MFLCAACVGAAAKSDANQRFRAQPSHTVLTKWYDSKGRRQRIYSLKTAAPVTLSSPAEKRMEGKCIILRSENLKIKAYTRGKVLYQSSEQDKASRGERITIIPVDEVKKGGTIYLHLTPLKNKTGAVTEPVYLMSNNEYLFSVLCREKAVIAGVFALFAIGISLLIFALSRRRCAALHYLLLADGCLILLLLSGSDLWWFVNGSGAAKESLHTAACLLLAATCTAGIIQKCRRFSYSR